jgi:heme oxygenase
MSFSDMNESRVLSRLQRETRLCHADADADRMAVMTASITPTAYRSFLVRIYGFEAPSDEALARIPGLGAYIELAAYTQCALLEVDLMALGIQDPAAYPRCELSQIATTAVALGWLYVLERNALVHGVVARYLHHRMPGPMSLAGSYLDEPRALRWRELGLALDRFAGNDDVRIDEIVYGARFAFRSQRSWYQTGGQQRAA